MLPCQVWNYLIVDPVCSIMPSPAPLWCHINRYKPSVVQSSDSFHVLVIIRLLHKLKGILSYKGLISIVEWQQLSIVQYRSDWLHIREELVTICIGLSKLSN